MSLFDMALSEAFLSGEAWDGFPNGAICTLSATVFLDERPEDSYKLLVKILGPAHRKEDLVNTDVDTGKLTGRLFSGYVQKIYILETPPEMAYAIDQIGFARVNFLTLGDTR